jgi:hypothetical protein
MTRARKRGSAVAILVLAAIASLEPTPVAALDKRYVDQDGDLVADTPAKTVDPPTLVFAYTLVRTWHCTRVFGMLYSSTWKK